MKRTLLALALLSPLFLLSAPAPVPRLTVGRAATPPTIDGVIGAREWQGAARFGHFVELDFSRLVPVQTQARLAWDDQNLYLAVACLEPNIKGLRAYSTDRDSAIWRDDCIELFLDPNHDRQSYTHIIVNAKGGIFDRQSPGDANWNGDFTVATKIGADSWSVEMAIPFQTLGVTAKQGMVWGLNLGRERYAEAKSPLSAWSATLGKFAVPDRFGDVVFAQTSDAPELTVPKVAFGPNRLGIADCPSKPDVRVLCDWPTKLPKPWQNPEPSVAKGGAGWQAPFRLVDGSETAVVVKTAGFRQALPISLNPQPQTALLAKLVVGLGERGKGDSPFAKELQEILAEANTAIQTFTQGNLARREPLSDKDWRAESGQQKALVRQLSGLSYVIWSRNPLEPLAKNEMPPSLAPESLANVLACGNEIEATTMVLTNLGSAPLEGRLKVGNLVLTDGATEETEAAPNLLLNGGLNEDANADGRPDHWKPIPSRGMDCAIERDAEGKTAFVMSASDKGKKHEANYRQDVQLIAGKTYTLTAELSAAGLPPDSASVVVINKGWTWSTSVRPVSPTSDRMLYSRTFKAPVADFFQVILRCVHPGDGVIRYHRVRLVEGQAASVSLEPSAITLHNVLFQDLRGGKTVADPLPVMNQAQSLVVPPGESRQVWASVNTRAVPPGRYTTSLSFVPFDPALPSKTLPVWLRVLPVRLPDRMPIAVFNWDYAKTEPEVADLASHRTNTFLVSTGPLMSFQPDGTPKGKVDWTKYDVALCRKLAYARANGGIILFSYGLVRDFDRRFSKKLGWTFMDAAWQKAFKAWALEFERHLRDDIGMAYDEYAVQLWDEATRVHAEQTAQAGAFLRTFAPKMRTCMDGAQDVAEIKLLDPVIDLWIPHQTTLYTHKDRKAIRALYKDLMKRGEPVWTYTCSTFMKALSPLDYYRLKEWRVWDLGVQGSCFWAYNSMRGDPWNDFDGEIADCGVMYEGQTAPITSRRWESTRDGREDYLCLHLLREASKGKADEKELNAFLDDTVAKALKQTNDPAAFQELRRNLLSRLADTVGSTSPVVTQAPKAVPISTGRLITWETAEPSHSLLLWRAPGRAQWHEAKSSKAEKKHKALLTADGSVPGPTEWYLILWNDAGATTRVISGLASENWF
jgi:hypothetical protein